jgi:hypothetical protein
LLSAPGTGLLLHFAADDIQVVAVDAAKRGATTLSLKARMFATVIIKPEGEKNRGNKQTINQ